jgi:hypothetical protein
MACKWVLPHNGLWADSALFFSYFNIAYKDRFRLLSNQIDSVNTARKKEFEIPWIGVTGRNFEPVSGSFEAIKAISA